MSILSLSDLGIPGHDSHLSDYAQIYFYTELMTMNGIYRTLNRLMMFRYNDYLFESNISSENFQEDRMKA